MAQRRSAIHPGKDIRLGGFEQGCLKTPSIDPRGPLTTKFIAIGMALKTYALAEDKERDKLRLKIRSVAAQLMAELHRARQRE
jgi:hypothetical protein